MSTSAIMTETIKTRFGEITVDTSKTIMFPQGLLGMPDRFHFVLTNFPNPKMQQFMLLQSVDDPSLSFITLPLNLQNAIIKAEDLRNACREARIDESNMAPLLIVSVHRSLNGVKLSVNARAPILVDAGQRMGVQYVFQQDTYKVQHML
jgi:flagellar assembly factor FliW